MTVLISNDDISLIYHETLSLLTPSGIVALYCIVLYIKTKSHFMLTE